MDNSEQLRRRDETLRELHRTNPELFRPRPPVPTPERVQVRDGRTWYVRPAPRSRRGSKRLTAEPSTSGRVLVWHGSELVGILPGETPRQQPTLDRRTFAQRLRAAMAVLAGGVR